MGFVSPTPPVHLHEYSLPALTQEVVGHVLFGVTAAFVTLNARLILLAGAESILIDADHVLPALNFSVEGRLAHSLSFAIVVALVLAYLAKRGGRMNRAVFLVTVAAVATHLSYDVFAGNGLFPLFAPFTMTSYSPPPWAWLPLESAAVLLCAMVRLLRSAPK